MRKMKKSTRQIIIALIIGIFIVIVGMVVSYILNSKKMEKQYSLQINNLQAEINANKKYVYKTTHAIRQGDIIEMSNLKYSEEFYSLNETVGITEEDIGKRALIDIDEGQAVLKNMIESDFQFGVREMEYSLFRFNSNILEGDLVDIRLSLPNGEDFIVIKKTALKNVDVAANRCNLWMNEEEILKLSSAIVDASKYKTAYLYTAKYIESNQEASKVTYQPSENVMLLMANDPNVLSDAASKLNLRERKELEERLSKSVNEGEGFSDEKSNQEAQENTSADDENINEETYSVDENYGE